MTTPEIPVELTLEKIPNGQMLRVMWINGGGKGRHSEVVIEAADGPLGVAKSLTEIASRLIEKCRVEGK